jgi:hypothetical protein
MRLTSAEDLMRRYLAGLFFILGMTCAGSQAVTVQTVLFPKTMRLFAVVVPPGWGTNQTDDGVNLQEYPPDKTCSIVVSYVKSAQYAGRSTADLATEIGTKAGFTDFASAGPGAISGVQGEAFSTSLQDSAGSGLWDAKLIFVALQPGFWAAEIVKWRHDATPVQQAACDQTSKGVQLIYR